MPPRRLAQNYKNSTPTSLTREQIAYLVAEADAKAQQRNKPWTAVPNPIPDTGIRSPAPEDKHSTVTVQHSMASISQSSLALSSSTHASILPSTTSRNIPSIFPSAIPTPDIAPAIPATTPNSAVPEPSRKLSNGAISLIAVAAVCLFLAILFVVRLCIRPSRPPRPVPSRPIIDSSFPEDAIFETKLEDSPVFGGKERLSERPNNGGMWQWTQYSASNQNVVSANVEAEDRPPSAASLYVAPMQQALNRAADRLSHVSASLYPASPAAPPAQLVTSFTADGHSVIQRVNPKVLQRSRSSTVGDKGRSAPPKTKRYSYGFAYDGAEVVSPKLPMQSPTIPLPQGRTRIMSSYYAHPRRSHAFLKAQETDYVEKMDSPATLYPTSPQPTLYPDDSLSMVEAKRAAKPLRRTPTPNKRASRADMRGVTASPTVDATAALGSLMLMDFGGTKQSALNAAAAIPSSSSVATTRSAHRTDDKPPRVPSPPPLPSLAQMGLEHANPEAYAEYRSPTYSLYQKYST
ncbi:hypothetical protein HMN09_00085900 [Mycena chlorophos]|uniref:Transmembrane protein n=1 Tax=Mycena chlorophos TaxID=658473 RepID=A0A8H6TU21_MYCCL|nr:hypothetical protein HMN09_00085900 [Mycena chlorophos]